MNNYLRKFELAGGFITALLGLTVPLAFEGIRNNLPKQFYLETFIIILSFFILPGLFFAFSNYFYIVRNNQIARKISLLVGSFYLLTTPFLFFLGGYGGGWKQALIAILPAISAILTLCLSLFHKH